MSCTFAARVAEYDDRVAEADAESSLEDMQEMADETVADGVVLLALIDDAKPGTLAAAGLSAHELDVLRDRVVRLKDRAAATSKDASAKIEAEAKAKAEKKAEAKAKQAAAEKKAEAQRQAEAEAKRQAEAQRQAEARQAEAQQQAEQAAAEEAERREQQAPPAPQPTQEAPPAPAPPPAPARPGAGYTGCRAYVGGPYIDDQGRNYTPIDCKTKLPLVP